MTPGNFTVWGGVIGLLVAIAVVVGGLVGFLLAIVLGALFIAGVPLRSACRNGSCRACLSQLLAGEVQYVIDWPGISREERAEGAMLPCVAQPRSDLRLQAGRLVWG